MTPENDFDFIVIGSGFGGSVSALRLTEKGYRVAVLEKGLRYEPADFPKTNWHLRRSVWMPRLGLLGIQALTLLRHVLVLHGVGVGGGSLVYANQLIEPDKAILDKLEWGSEDWKERLAPHFLEAKRMLGAVMCPEIGNADRILQQVGIELRGEDTFHINPVGVFFGESGKTVPDPYFNGEGPDRTGCKKCGACMIGCPVGAKNTLDRNYLYLAEKRGAQIFPATEVIGVRPGTTSGYEVIVQQAHGLLRKKRVLSSRNVIFSGGVLGTVDLLLRCKSNGMLPNLSDRLGDLTRTNSEAILGVDSRDHTTDWNDHIAITSGIYPDSSTHIEVVRYNKGSDLLYAIATILTDGGGKIPRTLRFLGNILRHPYQFLRALWIPGQSARTSVLLVMQSTENYLHLHRNAFGLVSTLPLDGKRIPTYIPIANEVTRRMAEKMKGYPKGSWFEVLLDAPTTAHILGGCVLGEKPEQGVVDTQGRIFGYPGLYVVDGSVIPVNLNANPALTITAVAEYFMSHIPEKESFSSTPAVVNARSLASSASD
ncbi:MAG: GMC family oxidoreductase [Chloroflexi bacterium]|nr:GMC family oxidoreductase [Chloroflexota bacterium]